jgi:hypothetical protein
VLTRPTMKCGLEDRAIRFPQILSQDFSRVTDFAVGDAVFEVAEQGIEGTMRKRLQ